MLGRRLADDAHQAWKWGSMRFLALGATVQGAVVTCPAQVSQHVPEAVWQALSCFSLFCMIAAGVSRVTTKDGDSHVRPADTESDSH